MELEQLSDEELEQLLTQRRKDKAAKFERERKKYEAERDEKVKNLMNKAKDLCKQLSALKDDCHVTMDEMHTRLSDYGTINKKSKGGFSITHSNDQMRIVRRRDTEPSWDERADKGVELIKEFLYETVKKRDKKLFEILLSFLERNSKGDLEFSRVFSLIKHRDKYQDKRWVEGLRLLEESFGNHLKGYGYEFKVKEEDGKWDSLLLNFSAL